MQHHQGYDDPMWPKERAPADHDTAYRRGEKPGVDEKFWIGLCWGALIMIPIWTLVIVLVDWVSG